MWLLAACGFGAQDVPFMQIMRLTAAFAGVAALLTAGGIGRLAAHAAVHGRGRAMWVAARAHAAASAGLVIIAAIPHGGLPETSWAWLPLPAAGLVTGALCGCLIGAVCGGAAPVNLADVWSLARRPTDAIGQLLGPRDLVKLGAALRDRTTHLFEGIFEPAPKPPEAPTPELAPPPPATSQASAPTQPTAKGE
ncbi:MAG: hypothetical protein SFX73_13875 [Kofleriaceae bacterium]|nr:hypothetical protein [Kofleriaceae bacterium]